MFSKAFFVSALVVALSLEAHAHAGVAPALGVKGQLARSDVQRPSNDKPCGNVNIAQTLDTSTPVQAAADGTFTVTATDFNPGADGSRQVTAQVDEAGTGKNFKTAQVTKNGQAAPAKTGSDQVVVKLPQGTKCTGGQSKNLCLAAFKTSAGFGNCVVVQQGGGGAAAKGGAAKGAAVDAAAGGAAGKATDETAPAKKGGKRRAVGSRAPRAARMEESS